MRKVFVITVVLLSFFTMSAGSQLFGQAADTLTVPSQIDGNQLDAINIFIKADVARTPNRVYKLNRGEIYFVNGPVKTNDLNLNIYGEEEDPNNPMPPAIIAPGIKPDGSSAGNLMQLFDDTTIRNVYFLGVAPNGVINVGQIVRVMTDGVRIEFDNCFFEWGKWLVIRVQAADTKIFVQNSYFRNNENAGGIYNGRGLDLDHNPADSVVMVNNTFVNNNSFCLGVRNNVVKYCRIEHNTMVNSLKWPIQWSWPTNAIISNNIFYNIHSYGEAPSDLPGQDFDGQLFGIVNIDTLPVDMTQASGVAEADRNVKVNNNVWFYDQSIQDYWAAYDTVQAEPFMNPRTQAMFDDDASYPGLEAKGNLNVDPGFTQPPPTDGLVQWMKVKRETGVTSMLWGWDPDNDPFAIQWPLPEDLSYSESSPLYTGGTRGYPVGDLRWFPERKNDWVTSVKIDEPFIQPTSFVLEQNYPNPFNPSTKIRFTLKSGAHVQVAIYNLLGQKIKTLVDQKLASGSQTVVWNGVHENGQAAASGVYFYTLKTGSESLTKKMLLLK